jgi:hypothetical protein
MAFEKLNFPFMLFRGSSGFKSAQVSSLTCLGINFPGIQSVFPGFQFADHI